MLLVSYFLSFIEIAGWITKHIMCYGFILGGDYQESLNLNEQMFKPGWKDIFRMNQNELESEIRKVYRDSTLDPRRKAYLVQNLMTRLVPMTIITMFLYNYNIINCMFI